MAAPKITLTILGANGSGKTLFMHGMYALLSAGVDGYFMRTADPDDNIDLMAVWRNLRKGELPLATAEDGEASYQFIFTHGIDPLVTLDFVDFRGGVVTSRRNSAADTAKMHARLLESDSIYLVLDGQHVAEWVNLVKDLGDGERAIIDPSYDPMEISRLTLLLQTAAEARTAAGRPAPSVVVLITKSDVMPELTGLSKGKALGVAARQLKTLLPIVHVPGITTLICPVQIGRLGASSAAAPGQSFESNLIDPINLHMPFVFSFWYHLTEAVQHDRDALRDLEDRHGSAVGQVATLRTRMLNGLFHTGTISSLVNDIDGHERDIRDLRRTIDRSGDLMDEMMTQLGRLPIIKDGLVQL